MWKILVFTMSANLNGDINVKGKKAMYVELLKNSNFEISFDVIACPEAIFPFLECTFLIFLILIWLMNLLSPSSCHPK